LQKLHGDPAGYPEALIPIFLLTPASGDIQPEPWSIGESRGTDIDCALGAEHQRRFRHVIA
jgi:hypothetical protein